VPAATNPFSTAKLGVGSGVYDHAALISKDDANDLATVATAIFVGGAGNIKVTTYGGETLLLTGLIAGQVLPLRVTRVWSTTTTATNIVALW
jgi:hypothetical protein